MSLKIDSVINASDPNKECVVLTTISDLNLKGYALVDRTFDEDGKVSNEFRHIYIFPDLAIKSNDVVGVFTGVPTDKIPAVAKRKKGEGNIYRLYWQSDSCVWNDAGGDTASLIKYDLINSVTVRPVQKEKK